MTVGEKHIRANFYEALACVYLEAQRRTLRGDDHKAVEDQATKRAHAVQREAWQALDTLCPGKQRRRHNDQHG